MEVFKNHPSYFLEKSPYSVYARHYVKYYVDVFERTLIVIYDGDVSEEDVYDILDERYHVWNSVSEHEDDEDYLWIHDSCCEEYMMEGLEDLDITYIPIYVDDSDED